MSNYPRRPGSLDELPLFAPKKSEIEQARDARDDGMDRAEVGASEEWKARAWLVLVGYLHAHEEFFAPDFWRRTGLEKPAEPRALGPLIMQAAKQRLIVRAGFRESTDPISHLRPSTVWRSLIYRGGQAA